MPYMTQETLEKFDFKDDPSILTDAQDIGLQKLKQHLAITMGATAALGISQRNLNMANMDNIEGFDQSNV